MTWTGRFTVQDVSDGPAPIDVLATVEAGDTWEAPGSDGSTHTMPSLYSNTEGKIRSVELRIVFDEDQTAIKVGDVIEVSGHFPDQS